MEKISTKYNHKETALKFLDLVTMGNIDQAYHDFVAEDGKHHNPYFPADFAALKAGMKENHLKFPIKQFTVKNVLADGDLVAVHSQIVLNPDEPGMAVVHLFRFQGDKIVELWDVGQPVPTDSPNQAGMF
jgi:predicted SnoaL-like aldol condensation-catalyzing enzyme